MLAVCDGLGPSKRKITTNKSISATTKGTFFYFKEENSSVWVCVPLISLLQVPRQILPDVQPLCLDFIWNNIHFKKKTSNSHFFKKSFLNVESISKQIYWPCLPRKDNSQ